MGRKLTFGSGSVSVTMDDAFEDLVRTALDRTFPGMLRKVELATEAVFDLAFAAWPVKSGVSRASLGWEVRLSPDLRSIRGRLFNTAKYAKFIRSAKIKTGSGSAYVELMRRPTERAGLALAEELREVIESTLGGK